MLPKLAEKSLNSQRDAVLWNNCIVQHPIKEYIPIWHFTEMMSNKVKIPKVMISHRCDDYHGTLQVSFEKLFRKFNLHYQYGCKLQHTTGIFKDNVHKTINSCEGFIAIITKSWNDRGVVWPEVEWFNWSNKCKCADKTRCMAFLINDAKPPTFLKYLQHYKVYRKDKSILLHLNMPLLDDQGLFQLWSSSEDYYKLQDGLRKIAEPIPIVKN